MQGFFNIFLQIDLSLNNKIKKPKITKPIYSKTKAYFGQKLEHFPHLMHFS